LTGIFFGTFLLALLSAFVLTRFVRDFANAHGWVAVPTQERHLHSSPLPRLGGVAIFLSFVGCMVLASFWAVRHPHLHAPGFLRTMITIMVPAALVFILGVYDDLHGVGPYFQIRGAGPSCNHALCRWPAHR
jgi:hypothetical protein